MNANRDEPDQEGHHQPGQQAGLPDNPQPGAASGRASRLTGRRGMRQPAQGMGIIAFSALAQGLLTYRYFKGVPEDSRASRTGSFDKRYLNDEVLGRIRALNEIAEGRGQTLAQLALASVLRDERMTSTLIGASSLEQLETNLGALRGLESSEEELARIDQFAVDADVNRWVKSSSN